jgi:hypothetical protein
MSVQTSNDMKLSALNVQLPNDVEVLRRYLFLLLRESADLGTPGLSIIYNDCVVSKRYPNKKVRGSLEAIDAFIAIPQATVSKYKGRLNDLLTEYPRVSAFFRLINKAVDKLGLEEFSYDRMMLVILKISGVEVTRKEALKPLAYYYLKEIGLQTKMKYNGRKRKREMVFYRILS